MPKVTAADFLLNHCKRVIAVNFLQLQKNLNVVQVRAIADPMDSPALTYVEVLRMMMVVKTETLWMLVEMPKMVIDENDLD